MAGFTPLQISLALIAALFAVIGVGVGLEARLRPTRQRIRLAGVGPLSRVSHTVIALACVGLGYHIAAHAFQWPLRAPMGTAVAVAAVAVLGSIAIDALEARADRRSGPPRDGGGAP